MTFFTGILKQIRTWLNRLTGRFRHGRVSREDLFIGAVLKRACLITEAQLKEALDSQRMILEQEGRVVRLGRVIVNLGYADETEIIQTINAEYQIEVTALTDNIRDLLSEKYGARFERLTQPSFPMWAQMAIATTFIVVLTTISLGLLVLENQKKNLYDQTVRLGMVSLNYFANNASIPLLEDDILRLNTLIKEAAHVEGLSYALIVGSNGLIKAHTNINLIGVPFKHFVDNPQTARKKDVIYYSYERPTGERLLNLYRPIIFKQKTLGEVHVGISLDFIDELVIQERFSVIFVTLAIIMVGLGVAVIYGFRFSRPISQLVKATEEIAKGNYQYRVPAKRKDELGHLGSSFNRMGQELWKNSMTQKSFGKYVGAEVLDMILANPETNWLKGTRNEATIVLCDIRGFTSYSTEKPPEEVVEALNAYLEIATTAIIQYGGYIDKFIGDAVMGVFGVPVFRKDHVERAVRSALHLQEMLHKKGNNGNQLLTAVGISIHTGVVVAGNVGSQSKMEYTVIGDSVNTTARLNTLAGAGDVVVSQQVKEHLSHIITTESLGLHTFKGKSEPMEVFKALHMLPNTHASN